MKTRTRRHFVAGIVMAGWIWSGVALGQFTPLVPVENVRLSGSAEAYPGGSFNAGNALDAKTASEYASASKGTNTFIELQLDRTMRLGAFRHLDRNDPATVAESQLVMMDAERRVTGTATFLHANVRGGETFFVFPTPVDAQRVSWRVTRLGSGYSTVGAADLEFFSVEQPEARPVRDKVGVRPMPFLDKDGRQPVMVTVHHEYAETTEAVLRLSGVEPVSVTLRPGENKFEIRLPGAESERVLTAGLEVGAEIVVKVEYLVKPVRPLTVYLLPHSHTDIGYTEIQTEIERKQMQNLVDGMAHARRTANYPAGARFIWNVEVLWAADLYLNRMDASQRSAFVQAVKAGEVSLCGMYLNELTGLCRPEELIRLFRYSTELSELTGTPIDSVMISDVPGHTWGTVTAMAQAGIKYFSTAPNYFDRIGTILREWENKPFWWIGPDGESKVLVWIPFWGYAMSHRYGTMSPQLVEDFCEGLEKRQYPYDIAYARWSGHGDNAVPDPAICEFVRDWNDRYAWPRFIISGASEAFSALEKRYGDSLPEVRGDWTPYWEDGAGSSARETALNRASSDRLAQAESLFAMTHPEAYPAADFESAWNHVLLYSEHTWGADCSVSQPESQKTREQWEIKQGYALAADQESRRLLDKALSGVGGSSDGVHNGIAVYSTTSWPRTELVFVPGERTGRGDRVVDDWGRTMASQRLASGQLAFVARDVSPFSKRLYRIENDDAFHEGAGAVASGAVLDNGLIRLRVDARTGAIVELTKQGLAGNLVDTSGGEALNDYLYLPGDDLTRLQRNGPVRISVGDRGPVVASLIIESDAPGCMNLRREVRLTAGMDHVEIFNHVNKSRLNAVSYHSKEGKESVNFAFPFNVPGGEMLVDLPLALMRPETDQMASACKNWFTIGRWVDISNADRGVTWVTLDAPLAQFGGITATLLNSQTNPDSWRKEVAPTQTVYSWAMNNHWGTNYRAYQEGPTLFRFVLRPHDGSDAAEASRFAIGFSQPLLAVPAREGERGWGPMARIEPSDILVSGVKPTDDGSGCIVRMFNPGNRPQAARLNWANPPRAMFQSDTSEIRGEQVTGSVPVRARGMATVRADR